MITCEMSKQYPITKKAVVFLVYKNISLVYSQYHVVLIWCDLNTY